jgi:Putative prokaryotic signal transducing protein
MAQDPERDDEQPEEEAVDTSHDLDMVPIYGSQTVEAEIEADVIRGILESNGVPCVVSGPNTQYPVFQTRVLVPKSRVDEARRLLEEAQAAGPEAAAEAEAASEEGTGGPAV